MKTIPTSPRALNALKPNLSLKDFYPLIGMLAIVIAFTAFAVRVEGTRDIHSVMSYFMAFFFLTFGALKTIRLHAFADAYATYDILASRSTAYAYAYPFIEITLGLLYLFGVAPLLVNAFTVVLMSVSAYGVWRELKKDTYIPCACLGTVFTIPMTHVTFVEDAVMAAMAGFMLLSGLMLM